jgi:hypothetical protein
MRRSSVSPVLLAAALSACALEPETLNSDRILQRFGSYDVEVVSHGDNQRRASLYSTHDGQRVCRTFAVVQFDEPVAADIAQTHGRVLEGESIGTTFRSSGWSIDKETLHIGTIPAATVDPDIVSRMHIRGDLDLALHVYRLSLVRDSRSLEYATIVEVHHPDYLQEPELVQLYGDDLRRPRAAASIAPFVALIQSD